MRYKSGSFGHMPLSSQRQPWKNGQKPLKPPWKNGFLLRGGIRSSQLLQTLQRFGYLEVLLHLCRRKQLVTIKLSCSRYDLHINPCSPNVCSGERMSCISASWFYRSAGSVLSDKEPISPLSYFFSAALRVNRPHCRAQSRYTNEYASVKGSDSPDSLH